MNGLATNQLGFAWNGVPPEKGSHPLASLPEIRGDDREFLQSKVTTSDRLGNRCKGGIPLVDLFCGVGGLSLGFHEAAIHAGLNLYTALAIDVDEQALDCYRKNFGGSELSTNDVREFFNPDFEAKLSSTEQRLQHMKLSDAILTGGPPCQGHSDLNNSTRRNDPKNSLYFIMARAARVLNPQAIVIENVPTVVHDRRGVVARTRDALESLGYFVSEHVFDFLRIGIPQTRKRHLMVACKRFMADRMETLTAAEMPVRTVAWAIHDLVTLQNRESLLDEVATPNKTTRKRIEYLFENELFELPNSQRPACHRLKKHSYKSIYGRLDWNSPSQTITRGFYCMCMGRYVHPSEPRTLTAHEAARLQFFPDWFCFDGGRTRTRLATLIGNAVPSKLGFLVGLELLEAVRLHQGGCSA